MSQHHLDRGGRVRLLVASALLALAGACADDRSPSPTCDLDDVARDAACQQACKPDDLELCPGSDDHVACLAECKACAPDVAWCPAGEP